MLLAQSQGRVDLMNRVLELLPPVVGVRCLATTLERWLSLEMCMGTAEKVRTSDLFCEQLQSALDEYLEAVVETPDERERVFDQFCRQVSSLAVSWVSAVSGGSSNFTDNEASWARTLGWRQVLSACWSDEFEGPDLSDERNDRAEFLQDLREDCESGDRLEERMRAALGGLFDAHNLGPHEPAVSNLLGLELPSDGHLRPSWDHGQVAQNVSILGV